MEAHFCQGRLMLLKLYNVKIQYALNCLLPKGMQNLGKAYTLSFRLDDLLSSILKSSAC